MKHFASELSTRSAAIKYGSICKINKRGIGQAKNHKDCLDREVLGKSRRGLGVLVGKSFT